MPNTHAGNRGDVVKHPALLAALDVVLGSLKPARSFEFADVYAGYARNVLTTGGSWQLGVASLRGCDDEALSSSALRRWLRWYVLPGSSLDEGVYPGSSRMAVDLAASQHAKLQVKAWDKESEPARDLVDGLGPGHTVTCGVAAKGDIVGADFVFVDPFALRDWSRIRVTVANCRNVLIWLPMSPTPGKARESGLSHKVRHQALRAEGYCCTRVRWDFTMTNTLAGIIGCQLLYRFEPAISRTAVEALRAAVDGAMALAMSVGWPAHVTHFGSP